MLKEDAKQYHILVVEDKPEFCKLYNYIFHELETKYGIKIITKEVSTYDEVCQIMTQDKKFNYAIVDMRIPPEIGEGEGEEEGKIHWGVQSLKKIEEVLALNHIIILTAYRDESEEYLTKAEKKQIRSKSTHHKLLMRDLEVMLGLT